MLKDTTRFEEANSLLRAQVTKKKYLAIAESWLWSSFKFISFASAKTAQNMTVSRTYPK